MCITTEPAILSGTQLYAGVGQIGRKTVHVLAYQNKAASAGANAMILPLPAAVLPDERNVIDTREFAGFLMDIHCATVIELNPCRGAFGAAAAKVFDVGSYSVVLARDASAISKALRFVPPSKRPAANPRLFEAFEQLYPGWPLAVCCWCGDVEAEPLLWWYEPKYPEWLFAPALDAHDGGPPDVNVEVEVDHHIAFGSWCSFEGNFVGYDPEYPMTAQIRNLLPLTVSGTRIHAKLPNGDFWLKTSNLSGPAIRRPPGEAAPGKEIRLGGWVREEEAASGELGAHSSAGPAKPR